jgi:hypothetical protein
MSCKILLSKIMGDLEKIVINYYDTIDFLNEF